VTDKSFPTLEITAKSANNASLEDYPLAPPRLIGIK